MSVSGSGFVAQTVPDVDVSEIGGLGGLVRRLTSGVEFAGYGLENPVALVGIPVLALVLVYVFFWRGSIEGASRRRRTAVFVSRLVIVALLVLGAAQPYAVQTKETPGDPRVKMLVDGSNSMDVTGADSLATDLAGRIESNGVPVETVTVGSGNDSRIGDAVLSNLEQNGSLLLVSDGRVTSGRSLEQAASVARSVNATINAVNLTSSQTQTERAVRLHGPAKTSVGVENRFLARVTGTGLKKGGASLTVSVDGEQKISKSISGETSVEFKHTFETTGSHRITATVGGGDRFSNNNVFRKTVEVVEKPKILYVSRGNYPLENLLKDLYDVDTAESVPSRSELKDYYAVVIQNVAAGDIGNVNALQTYAIDGNGVVVVGGPNSYDKGGYSQSTIGNIVPVRMGESSQSSRIVLAVDISGSTTESMSVQKALALDVIEQLGDENQVGVIAFNQGAYRVADLQTLGGSRAEIKNTIRRLQNGGSTSLSAALKGASDLLGGGTGNVILISDGVSNDEAAAFAKARQMNRNGIRVITVGVGGNTNDDVMRGIAQRGGGTFFPADETSSLRVFFGGENKKPEGQGLSVVNSGHFITRGVKTTADPANAHKVTVKDGAEFLVASGSGRPAVASWRYGLGRVVSFTAYGNNGGLDGMLSSPDSLLVSKSVNWAIGDPQRKTEGVDVADTRVGVPTRATYTGSSPPSSSDLSFSKTGESDGQSTYSATIVPSETGFKSVMNDEYAVNYPHEYDDFGLSESLRSAVRSSGGRLFEPNQASAIAKFVKSRSTKVREVRENVTWIVLSAALVIYLIEIMARRIYEIYGYRLPDVVPTRLRR
ncbi:MAG: VWA domain-containing protein [Halobacteria archaeon]|nr:VWA domain-containing protein [Halobacteria archaeon]